MVGSRSFVTDRIGMVSQASRQWYSEGSAEGLEVQCQILHDANRKAYGIYGHVSRRARTGQDLTLTLDEIANHCFNPYAPIWLSKLSNRTTEGTVLTVPDRNLWFGASQSAGRLMKLLTNIFAIVVAGSSLAPFIADGQVVTPERTVGRVVVDNFQLLPARPGISRPNSQDFLRNGTTASALTLPLRQTRDSSQSSQAHDAIIGALVGGAVGLVVGLLLDHTAKNGRPGSGEQVTYTLEVYTIPTGAILGAVSGSLVATH